MKPTKAAREYLRYITRKGGKARAKSLTPEQRKQIARDAARARWAKSSDKGVS